MANTMHIEITNDKAMGLLHELEKLHFIKVVRNAEPLTAGKTMAEKYRGCIPKEYAEDLKAHIKQMRSEWDNI
jgi:hypothetical protein